jgi:protein involved in polysaccharide export with SLBB domain
MVQGWVNKPGNYKITPGLTVLGALAAAGGPLFAANKASVKVARTGRNGEKLMIVANISRIQADEEPDIPVREGDVVDVTYSNIKIVPYAVYNLITKIAVGVPLIP